VQMIDLVSSLRHEACLTACLEHGIVEHGYRFARRQDEQVVCKGRQLHALVWGETVLWRQRDDERFADDKLAVQRGIADRWSHESHIELAVEERRDLRGQRHRQGLDLNVLMLIAEGAEERRNRTSFAYYQGERRIPEPAASDTKNRSWRLTADVDIPAVGAEGMIATLGGLSNGWALYLLKGRPVFHYTFGFIEHYNIEGPQALTPGHHTVVFDFQYDGGGIGKGATAVLSVDGAQAATGRIEHTVGIRYTLNVESFDIGEDTGTAVNTSYNVPFPFDGTIRKVTIDLKAQDRASADAAAQAERQRAAEVLKRQ